jgi:hypothetical protein
MRKFAKDGKPLKLNANGLYVLDQTRWHKQQQEAAIEKLTAVIATQGPAALEALNSGASAPVPAPAPALPSTAPDSDRTAKIREAVARCFAS